MVKIVADTTAGLDPAWVKQHQVPYIPQIINFGEESFLELEEISLQEFLHRLKTGPVMPRTAAPPPGRFIQAFKELDADKNAIICVHPSSELSGTCRSAQIAKEEAFPNADIRIVDTRTIAGPLAYLVMRAVEWAEAGVDADTIVSRLNALIPRMRAYFVVDTLEFLRRGGRIGGAAALVGEVLQVKPILMLRDGRVEAYSRERTKRRATQRVMDLALEEMSLDASPCLSIMHSEAPDEAQMMCDYFKQKLGRDDFMVMDLVPAIVTHAGPKTLAVGFVSK